MQTSIETLFDRKPAEYTAADRDLFRLFLESLNQGRIRAAEPDGLRTPAGASTPG